MSPATNDPAAPFPFTVVAKSRIRAVVADKKCVLSNSPPAPVPVLDVLNISTFSPRTYDAVAAKMLWEAQLAVRNASAGLEMLPLTRTVSSKLELRKDDRPFLATNSFDIGDLLHFPQAPPSTD